MLPDVAWPVAHSAAFWAFCRRQNAPNMNIFCSQRETIVLVLIHNCRPQGCASLSNMLSSFSLLSHRHNGIAMLYAARTLPFLNYFELEWGSDKQTIVPSLSRSSLSSNETLYDSSFAVRGPRLWNIVPENVKLQFGSTSLKTVCPVFLPWYRTNPWLLVAGYRSSWSNSLVDYSPVGWSEIWWPFLIRG